MTTYYYKFDTILRHFVPVHVIYILAFYAEFTHFVKMIVKQFVLFCTDKMSTNSPSISCPMQTYLKILCKIFHYLYHESVEKHSSYLDRFVIFSKYLYHKNVGRKKLKKTTKSPQSICRNWKTSGWLAVHHSDKMPNQYQSISKYDGMESLQVSEKPFIPDSALWVKFPNRK